MSTLFAGRLLPCTCLCNEPGYFSLSQLLSALKDQNTTSSLPQNFIFSVLDLKLDLPRICIPQIWVLPKPAYWIIFFVDSGGVMFFFLNIVLTPPSFHVVHISTCMYCYVNIFQSAWFLFQSEQKWETHPHQPRHRSELNYC